MVESTNVHNQVVRKGSHTHILRFGGTQSGIIDRDDPERTTGGPVLGGGCCVPFTPTSPPSVVFPLHSSLQAVTHAPQSLLSSGSRQPLRESMET